MKYVNGEEKSEFEKGEKVCWDGLSCTFIKEVFLGQDYAGQPDLKLELETPSGNTIQVYPKDVYKIEVQERDDGTGEWEYPEWFETVEFEEEDFETDHYTEGSIECVDYLWDNMTTEAFIGGLEWNTKKYLHRWRHKGRPVQDLKKARDYLNVWIEVMEGKEPEFKEWRSE